MFGLLGAGLGVGFTTAFFKSEFVFDWQGGAGSSSRSRSGISSTHYLSAGSSSAAAVTPH